MNTFSLLKKSLVELYEEEKHRKGNYLGDTMYPSRPNTTRYTQREWL